MTIEESVFEGYRADFEALAAHGFAEREGAWTFTVPIPKTDFTATVRVDGEGNVTGRVTDPDTGEDYLPLRAADAHGGYVAAVREAYTAVLCAVRRYCFERVGKVGSWLIPSNPKIYDVAAHFETYGSIVWKQPRGLRLGDFVYVYFSSPYSCLMYKCEAVRTGFADYAPNCMELQVLRHFTAGEYPLALLRGYGLKTVRFPVRLPDRTAEFLYDT